MALSRAEMELSKAAPPTGSSAGRDLLRGPAQEPLHEGVVLAAALAVLSAGTVKAGDVPDGQATIRGCITTAAEVYRLPPAVLVILLNVEGGSLGRVSPNTNGTVDIGPIQINQIWLPEVAAHWHATIADAYKALRDNFCANVEAGAWILRRGLDEARGNFWEGWATTTRTRPSIRTGIFGRCCGRSSGCARWSSSQIRPPGQTWRKRPRRPSHRRVDPDDAIPAPSARGLAFGR